MTGIQPSEVRVIAGFWRRLGAFFLDWLLLFAVGFGLGLFLTNQFVRMGPWGALLGFAIALAYFGPQNSRLTGGQTLAKRCLKVRVVAADGTPLSVPKSFLRFLPLGTPWFLSSAKLSVPLSFSIWHVVLSVATLGIGAAIVYLYFFNVKTRQSLHDLLVGSYVVSADATGPVEMRVPWRGHLVIATLLVVASALAPFLAARVSASAKLSPIMSVYRAVLSEPWVIQAKVAKGSTVTTDRAKGRTETTYLGITAFSRDSDVANAQRAKRLATLALAADSSVRNVDVIQVMLAYGYDIGIASAWRQQRHAHSPAEWLAQ